MYCVACVMGVVVDDDGDEDDGINGGGVRVGPTCGAGPLRMDPYVCALPLVRCGGGNDVVELRR